MRKKIAYYLVREAAEIMKEGFALWLIALGTTRVVLSRFAVLLAKLTDNVFQFLKSRQEQTFPDASVKVSIL